MTLRECEECGRDTPFAILHSSGPGGMRDVCEDCCDECNGTNEGNNEVDEDEKKGAEANVDHMELVMANIAGELAHCRRLLAHIAAGIANLQEVDQ